MQVFRADERLLGIARALLGEHLCYNGEATVMRKTFAPDEHIGGTCITTPLF
jgi:hypothetical protein